MVVGSGVRITKKIRKKIIDPVNMVRPFIKRMANYWTQNFVFPYLALSQSPMNQSSNFIVKRGNPAKIIQLQMQQIQESHVLVTLYLLIKKMIDNAENQKYKQTKPNYKNNKEEQAPQEECQSSLSQQIMIKNIDSGSYQLFNIQEVDSVSELKEPRSAQIKVSLWNSYWEELSKTDLKLLKLVLNKQAGKLRKILNEQPIELNTYTYMDGWTLLHHAVVSSSEQIVKILIQNKIDLNTCSNEMKRSPLHEAVLSNRLSIVGILVNFQIDPNLQDIDGNTSLHYAAELSYLHIFEALMKPTKRIDFTIKNHQQMTVLDCIRDQKLFKTVQTHYPQIISQNQNLQIKSQNRRVVKLSENSVLKRYSKSDMVERFLNYKHLSNSEPTQNGPNQFSLSIKSDSSRQNIKKNQHLLGKRPSHWIQKKGKVISCQSICLMKQSVLEPAQDEGLDQQTLANYQILRFIGSGGFAEVFLARKKRSSKLFALKRINKSKVLENNLKRYVYSERNIMIKCNHPFIVQAYSMFQDDVYLYIAMEYCECGDLQQMISQKGKFSEEQAKFYATQIGLALQEMHSKNILFRDLKSANVLIAKDGYVKVSDFGLAKQSLVSFSFLGSVQYLAPQMLVDTQMKQHTKSIDWYLFGVLIYELVTGKPPFYGEKQHILFKKIRQQKPVFPSYLSSPCKKLLSRLLQKDPSKRLGSQQDFDQIKLQEWFQQVDFNKVLLKQNQTILCQPLIKQSDLRKKIPIDDFLSHQKYEFFKEWNYVKQN